LRSVLQAGCTILSECLDSLPSIEQDTGLDTILAKMEQCPTDILPVVRNNLLIGIVSAKNIAHALFKSKYSQGNRFSLIKKQPTILIYTNDRNLRYSWVYSTNEKFNAEIMIGKTDRQLFDSEDAVTITSIKQKVLETGIPLHTQVRARIKGKQYYYQLIAEPMKNSSGIVEGILGAGIDISPLVEKNQELERSRDHFLRLADSIAEICLTLNKDLRVTYWGKTLGQLSGISPEKALGKPVEELYPLIPKRKRLVNLIREVFLTGRIARTTYKHLDKTYDFNMYPLADGVTIIAYSKPDKSCCRSSYIALWENELKNTAQTIHNDFGQYLSALSMRCAEMVMKAKRGVSPVYEDIVSIHKICICALDSLRHLTQSILWRAGDAIPDTNIIQCICGTIEKSFGVVIEARMPESFIPEGIFERKHIMKFIQEALTNAAKHSGVSEVSLKIESNREYFSYIISDKGCGFDVSQAGKGMGLKMMQFNADELAAEMKLTSNGGGTTVTLLLPRY
jgi:PAS domain-containing protein